MISYDEVTEKLDPRRSDYGERHDDHARLRKFWHGQFWEVAQSGATGSNSVFRDMMSTTGRTPSPDVKLVHNVLQEVCVKFQAFLSPTPMIRVYTDPPESNRNRARATKKERFLYGMWAQRPTGMTNCLNLMGWYLPLMGDVFLGAVPDLKRNLVSPVIKSPEAAYPLPSLDGGSLEDVIFSEMVRESRVAAAFPNYQKQEPGKVRPIKGRFRSSSDTDPEIEVIEYSDSVDWARWADGQKVNGVEHSLGFNLYDQCSFITVPGEPWNHGAVEQAVGLVEMGNALYSLMFQATLEHVFPTLFLINPMKMPAELDLGPGGVVPINEGGDAKWLNPSTQTLQAQLAMLQENERAIKQATSMPDVNFGQFNASIITGKAINELQGAGTGSTIEMVQGASIGPCLVSWNEKAISMAQRMFTDDEMHLNGVLPLSMAEVNPKQFTVNVKGSDLVGSPRNEVVFAPHMSMHEKVVMGLQMAGAGLVSKQWQREQAGINDSDAMQEQIVQEAVQDGVLAAILQSLQQAVQPEQAADLERQALGYLAGATPAPGPGTAGPPTVPGAAPLPPGAPAPPGGGPPPPGAPAPGGMPALPPGAGPVPQPVPATSPQAASQPGAPGFEINQVVEDFQSLQGITGRIFLVGEIVAEGFTQNDLEVALTDGADRQRIVEQLPEYRGELQFRRVPGEPKERFLEVTPGSDPLEGGPMDVDLDAEEAPIPAGAGPPGMAGAGPVAAPGVPVV